MKSADTQWTPSRPSRNRRARRALCSFLALGAVACSSETSTQATIAPPTAAGATTAPTLVPTTATITDAAPEVTQIENVTYLTIGGTELLMDASVPAGDGPWPVVVLFHGNSSLGKDVPVHDTIAHELADEAIVFSPTWIAGDPFPLSVSDIVDLRRAANCSVSFAQQWATELGGDPSNTVVYGFSAGAGPALAATVAPEGDVADCETRTAPLPVTGAVLGDGEYFYPSQPFDGAFEEDLEAMRAEVAALADPARWPADLDANVFVWAAADRTAPRVVGDPLAPDAWLDDRDADGSIQRDLEALMLLDDGVVDYVDAAEFIGFRLREAGVDTAVEIFPGGHTVADKIDELVTAIREVGSFEPND